MIFIRPLGALERHGLHAIKELPAPAVVSRAGGRSRCKPDRPRRIQRNIGLSASLPHARPLASSTNAQVSLKTAASPVSMVVRACQKHPDIYSSYPHPTNTIVTIINTNINTTAPPTRLGPSSRTARQIPIDLAGHPEPPMPDPAIAATYRGHVASTQDALIVFEACLRGVLYHTCRRPRASEESSLAKSGNIFVYESRSSGIRSWEDGITWSTPQRVGNFEICRQLSSSSSRSRSNGNHSSAGRLCRKSISVTVRGITHHLVAYFSTRDFTANTLLAPSADLGLVEILPRPELYSQGFRAPIDEDDRDEVMLMLR